MLKDKKLAILGSGFMAKAIAGGLVKSGAVSEDNIIIINSYDAENAKKYADSMSMKYGTEKDLPCADIVICAFKPQNLAEAKIMYAPYWNQNQLVISIMAGIEIEMLEDMVPKGTKVIRTMPNLALGVEKSATAYSLGTNADNADGALCEEIFGVLGIVEKTEEKNISTVTGLSGSGPAYFYYLAECMIESAVEQGLERSVAETLCKQTFLGTAKLWENDDASPDEMRRRITSAKGTTDAAIRTMQACGLAEAVNKGCRAAADRSNELAKEMKNK